MLLVMVWMVWRWAELVPEVEDEGVMGMGIGMGNGDGGGQVIRG